MCSQCSISVFQMSIKNIAFVQWQTNIFKNKSHDFDKNNYSLFKKGKKRIVAKIISTVTAIIVGKHFVLMSLTV